MSEEETRNKMKERRFFEEIWSKGNFAVVDDLVAPDYIDHNANTSTAGPEGVREEVSLYRNAFPDLVFTIEDVIAEGDRVAVRWTNAGTNVGDFLGIPATGRSFSVPGIDIYRLEDGKLAEHWHVVDMYGQLIQLGLLPAPDQNG